MLGGVDVVDDWEPHREPSYAMDDDIGIEMDQVPLELDEPAQQDEGIVDLYEEEQAALPV